MRALCLAPLVLVGCSAGSSSPVSDPIDHMLDTNGVQLLDSSLRIDFDRTEESTIPAMSKVIGSDPQTQGICANGASFVEWRDGTRLILSGQEFKGWEKDGARAGLTCA